MTISQAWVCCTLFWVALYTAMAFLISWWFLVAVGVFAAAGIYAVIKPPRPKRRRPSRRQWPV
jgi:hypothetical protein